jgi:hypothetical protein
VSLNECIINVIIINAVIIVNGDTNYRFKMSMLSQPESYYCLNKGSLPLKLAKGLVLQHVPVSLQTKYGSLLHMVWTVRLMKSGRRHNASNLFGYSLA